MKRRLLVLVLPCVASCSGIFGDKPGSLGEPLGTYHVVAHQSTSSCGAGALGATDPWEFDVQLSRDGETLYWKNGTDAIEGQVGSDGTFSFASSVTVTVQPRKGAMAGCAIGRADAATGKLDGTTTDVPSFGGNLTYHYTPTSEDNCAAFVGNGSGMLAGLPCDLAYTMTATRTSTSVTQR